MTAVPIAQIFIVPSPASAKSDAQPVTEASLGDLIFKDLLGTASDELKGESDSQEDPQNEHPMTLPVIAAVFTAMLPAATPASFGLPSAGDEAGPAPLAAMSPAPDPMEAPDAPQSLSSIASPAPAEKSDNGPPPELAFALRLVDVAQAPSEAGPVLKSAAVSRSLLNSDSVGTRAPAPAEQLDTRTDAPLKLPVRADPARPLAVVRPVVEAQKLALTADDPRTPLLRSSSKPLPIVASPPVDAADPVGLPIRSNVVRTPAVARLPIDETNPAPRSSIPSGSVARKAAPGTPQRADATKLPIVDGQSRLPIERRPALQPVLGTDAPSVGDARLRLPIHRDFVGAAETKSAEETAGPSPIAKHELEWNPPAQRNAASRQIQSGDVIPDPAVRARIGQPEESALTDNPERKPDQPRVERKTPAAIENAPPRENVAPAATMVPAISPAAGREPNRVAAAAPAEPAAPAPRQITRPEVTDVSVTVPGAQSDSGAEERIAIRMVQRGGEIHVAVRTPDPQAAQSMRQDLSHLAASLDEAGFRADTWRPAASSVASPSSAHGQREFSQDARQQDTAGSDAQSNKQDGRSPGEQKRRQQDERPQWVAELERQRK